MIYVSIDIETTGLDPKNDQILQIGAIIEDTTNLLPFEDIPKFDCIIRHERITGSPYALAMNSGIIAKLAESDLCGVVPERAVLWLFEWMNEHISLISERQNPVWAGKNVSSFDLPFLRKISNWSMYFADSGRTLDPAILFVDWEKDKRPPSLQDCLQRRGFSDSRVVTHDAVSDAWDVICCLRKAYEK
jgi:oligoribonuclease